MSANSSGAFSATHAASVTWSSARCAFVSVPYATSRMRPCANRNARSPAIDEWASGVTNSRSSSRSRRAGDVDGRARARRARRARRRGRSAPRAGARASRTGSRLSIRAAISACTESGMRLSVKPSPSASTRAVSSRNSGLPSAFSSASARCAGGTSAFASRASTSSRLWSAVRAPSSSAIARGLPPPQAGRVSRRSGRATQTISTGESRSARARCSTTSSSGSSAHCTSSKTSTSGCACASCSAHSVTAHVSSPARAPVLGAPSTPSATASRSATASLSQHIRSFSNASAAGASSLIPAEDLIIEASGQ